MNTLLLLQLFIAGIVPAILVFILPKKASFFHKEEIKGFALGVYLALVLILLYEAIEIDGLSRGVGWFSVGLLGSFFLGMIIKEFHHHHGESEARHVHTKSSTIRLFISDVFHNVVDGIALSAGGFVAMFGILGHQTIQQFGQQILLVEGGVKPYRALFISLVISLSIFTTLFISGDFGSTIEPVFIALSAGVISWKVFEDFFHVKYTKKFFSGFLVGAVILSASLLIVPHEHGDGHTDHELEIFDLHADKDHGHGNDRHEGDGHMHEENEVLNTKMN
jgi:hypothetical protein